MYPGYNKTADYKDANAVIDKLIDIVSKNGNLLLNVPPKADGTLDEETITILRDIGDWFAINGEGIYETRPWKVFGEGPDTEMKGRANSSPYTYKNIRFTQSKDGNTLYAILMGWPGENARINLKSFSKDHPGENYKIEQIEMLGSTDKIKYKHSKAGLSFTAPKTTKNDLAVIFKISLKD